jgi:hypothetical protein
MSSPPDAPQVLPFIARRTQLRLRETRNITRYINLYGHYIQPSAEEQERLERERLEHAQRDEEWRRRHAPRPEGAQLVPFVRRR